MVHSHYSLNSILLSITFIFPFSISHYFLFSQTIENNVLFCKILSQDDKRRVMRKPAFCICENKDTDQLGDHRAADQRLCFRYINRTIPLLPNSEISSLLLPSVAVQPGLCEIWSKTPKTGFLASRLIKQR